MLGYLPNLIFIDVLCVNDLRVLIKRVRAGTKFAIGKEQMWVEAGYL